MRGASADYALLQARAIRDNFGADWGLAESGPVGECTRLIETGSDDRIANMAAFTRNALEAFEHALEAAGPC
jgi:hypothetical protein